MSVTMQHFMRCGLHCPIKLLEAMKIGFARQIGLIALSLFLFLRTGAMRKY